MTSLSVQGVSGTVVQAPVPDCQPALLQVCSQVQWSAMGSRTGLLPAFFARTTSRRRPRVGELMVPLSWMVCARRFTFGMPME